MEPYDDLHETGSTRIFQLLAKASKIPFLKHGGYSTAKPYGLSSSSERKKKEAYLTTKVTTSEDKLPLIEVYSEGKYCYTH